MDPSLMICPRGRACSGASLNRQLLPSRLSALLASSPLAFDVGRAETLQLAMAACIGLFACPSLSPYQLPPPSHESGTHAIDAFSPTSLSSMIILPLCTRFLPSVSIPEWHDVHSWRSIRGCDLSSLASFSLCYAQNVPPINLLSNTTHPLVASSHVYTVFVQEPQLVASC